MKKELNRPKRPVIDKMIDKDCTAEERRFICDREFMYFCMYYFAEFFTHKFADFHLEAFDALKFEKNKYYIMEWFREGGKRQSLDAKILTPHGFTTMGDLELGDEVIGADGKAVCVEYLSEIVERMVYRIETEDGRSTECDEEHLWTIRHMSGAYKNKLGREHETMDVRTMLENGLYYERVDNRINKTYKEYKYAVPTVKPIEFSEKEFSIDPYFLGLWLGDGSSDGVRITTVDDEVRSYLQEYAFRLGMKLSMTDSGGTRTPSYAITKNKRGGEASLQGDLRKLGVLGDKHVPEEYLLGSIHQRRSLLEGLMDTDGTCGVGRSATFSNKNERIVDGVVDLVRSLGGRAVKRERQTSCVYKGVRKFCKSWRVSINFSDYTPFRLQRKASRFRRSNRTFSRIVSIEPVKVKKGRCIKVGNDDGLYVTDDYLLTHNTTLIKMYITYCICLKKKNYIIYICYEKDTAKQHLYDIAVWLQSNKYLIADFGQLFFENTDNKQSKKKSVSEFITANHVKVEASSTQEPLRGRVYGQFRPDFLIFDDFENEKTKKSFVITEGITKNMDEALAGLGGLGNIVYLCNYISDMGSVERLHQAAGNDPAFYYHRVDVVQNIKNQDKWMSGDIAWPTKYVFTDQEASLKNATVDRKDKWVVSLEAKKRTLNARGRPVFEQEMLNQPIVKGDKVFDPDVLRKMIAEDVSDPDYCIGEWQMWGKYTPSHRYGMGGDTSEGVGQDACAGVLIDFSAYPRAKVVGTYQNAHIAPDNFAYELANIGHKFGECVLAPELNNTGFATVTRLKDIYNNVYQQESGGEKIIEGQPTRYGWVTNMKTKPEIIFDLKNAIEEGMLEIPDVDLLYEIMSYNQAEIRETKAREGMTKHFDKFMALAIAWRMRNVAVIRGGGVAVEEEEVVGMDKFDVF